MFLFLIEALSIWKSCLGARYPAFNVSIVVIAGKEDTISAIWELPAKNLALNLLTWCKPHSKHSSTYKLPVTGHTLPLWQGLLLVLLNIDISSNLLMRIIGNHCEVFIIFNVEYLIHSVWESCLVCCHCLLWIQTFLSLPVSPEIQPQGQSSMLNAILYSC